MCDLILFMTKMCPIPGLENKKVSVDVSYLDTISNTLIVSTTDAGHHREYPWYINFQIQGFTRFFINIICLDTELAIEGGLQVVGWLEGPTGLVSTVRTKDNPKNLAFAVSLGSTYELVSAVYARGRMLARLQNFTFQCPQNTKKQMKKYVQNVLSQRSSPRASFRNFLRTISPQPSSNAHSKTKKIRKV